MVRGRGEGGMVAGRGGRKGVRKEKVWEDEELERDHLAHLELKGPLSPTLRAFWDVLRPQNSVSRHQQGLPISLVANHLDRYRKNMT